MKESTPYPDIQEQRDNLAKEIKSVRKQRDEKRAVKPTLVEKMLGRPTEASHFATAFDVDARNKLKLGKQSIEHALDRYRQEIQELESAGTDHSLMRWYYKRRHANSEVSPIATDTFIDKSREEYNAAWLAREIVQNFVDHNHPPGTLNGVQIEKQDVEGDPAKKRYIIKGNWSFKDPSGIISPHSDKPEGVHTGGGNGIGLKQVAIRYLRDFGVTKFDVHGEGWVVDYHLVYAKDVNREIQAAAATAKKVIGKTMKHDWLTGKFTATEEGGACSYVIETDNAQVIAALDQIHNIGVSETNEFLQNLDFKNNHGAIRWIPPGAEGGEPSRGRLFINGQVMNYGTKGNTAEDYWVGPEYMTLELDNVRYRMSVDRPPLASYDLRRYADALISSMTMDEAIEQLKRSEPIWTVVQDRRIGAIVVITQLIERLQRDSKYRKEDFGSHFHEKKYLAMDGTLSEAQIHDLRKQGYVLCPREFEHIGMPKATEKLSNVDVAAAQKPDWFRARNALEKIAEESGVQVACEDLSSLNSEQLLTAVRDRLRTYGFEMVQSESDPKTVRLKLKTIIPKELLAKIIPNPKTEPQKLLYFLRGVALRGLGQSVFQRMFLAQGEYVTTFDVSYDSTMNEQVLFARNIKAASDEGVFIELEFNTASLPLKHMLNGVTKIAPTSPTKSGGDVAQTQVIGEAPGEGGGDSGKAHNVIVKEVQPSLTAAQVGELEKAVPGISAAVGQLEKIVTGSAGEKTSGETPIEKYRRWRDSDQAIQRAEETAGYINGRSLGEIVSAYNQASIPVAIPVRRGDGRDVKLASELQTLKGALQEAINKVNPDGEIQDFEMVFDPKPRQLAQLGLLRMYAYLTTGAGIKNKLFLFRGTGTTGINMGREAIGIHEEELNQSFLEAVGIFTHELAHNQHMNHDVGFMTTMEALFLETNRKLTEIALKAKSDDRLTDEEEAILSIVETWNKLRNQGD